MRRQQHGDTPAGRRGKPAPARRARSRRRGATATPAADAHAVSFLFPQLQADPTNLLPETPTTPDDLFALGVAMDGVGADSDIPAAYTYFGQFVDHDVTLEGVTAGVDLNGVITPMSLADISTTLVNTRTGTLDLDSVYGAPAARDPGDASLMQLGDVTAVGGRPPGKSVDNDLPRRGRSIDESRDREALIGDPRNDENLVVAQLHVALLKAHNMLVSQGLTFEQAQTTLRQHYQHVVVHDFLMRIADPAIVADILTNGPKAFDPGANVKMPLEFSVAAYRFGHSMIREQYNYNLNFPFASLGLLFTFTALSGQIFEFDTLPENWIIQWERFLDAGAPFTTTHALDTLLVEPLAHLPLTTFGELPGNMARLAVRNLLRGYLLRLPTGQAVATALGITPLTADELATAAANDEQRDALTAGGFDTRTPLWYYVLAEAAHFGANRLGPVGSTIVADVLIGLMHRSDDSILELANWAPTLPSHTPGTFELLDLLVFAGVATDGRPDDPGPDPEGGTYTVVAGDSLSSIAANELGDENRWPEIFDLNRDQIDDPSLIFAGQVLVLPPAEAPATRSIFVRRGDTLWDIAASRLGDGKRWPEIVALNPGKIDDPDLIHPGDVLTIPG